MGVEHFRESGPPTRWTGLSAVIGSWKIIDMAVARRARMRFDEALRTFSPFEQDLPARRRQSLGQEPHHGERSQRLAGTGFAHEAHGLAGF